jgi:hypothetical protein
MTLQDIGIAVTIAATALGGIITIIRFLVKHYLSELRPNGGSSLKDQVSSLKDQVNRLETRVDKIYDLLMERS